MARKNRAAQSLARKRWEGRTQKEREDTASNAASARWASMTAEQQAAHIAKMNAARAKKHR